MQIKERCPKCGAEMDAEFVDIGIGFQQMTEARCVEDCDANEYFYAEYVRNQEKLEKPVQSFEEWLWDLTQAGNQSLK